MSNEITLTIRIRRAVKQDACQILIDRTGQGDDMVEQRADEFEQAIHDKFHALLAESGGEVHQQEDAP